MQFTAKTTFPRRKALHFVSFRAGSTSFFPGSFQQLLPSCSGGFALRRLGKWRLGPKLWTHVLETNRPCLNWSFDIWVISFQFYLLGLAACGSDGTNGNRDGTTNWQGLLSSESAFEGRRPWNSTVHFPLKCPANSQQFKIGQPEAGGNPTSE